MIQCFRGQQSMIIVLMLLNYSFQEMLKQTKLCATLVLGTFDIAARSKALANLAKLLPYYKDVNLLDSSKNSPLQILLIEVYWDYIDAKRDPKDFVPIFKAFIQKGALTNIPFGTHQAPNGFQNLFQLIQALHCPELEVAHQGAQVKP